jgi:hypothetical protein
MFCHIFNLLICKDFTKEANEIAAVGGGAFNVRKGKPLQTSPKGRLKRPHPTSHKGRRKKRRIIHKILFWGVMVTAFRFAVAFANGSVNWVVSVTI